MASYCPPSLLLHIILHHQHPACQQNPPIFPSTWIYPSKAQILLALFAPDSFRFCSSSEINWLEVQRVAGCVNTAVVLYALATKWFLSLQSKQQLGLDTLGETHRLSNPGSGLHQFCLQYTFVTLSLFQISKLSVLSQKTNPLAMSHKPHVLLQKYSCLSVRKVMPEKLLLFDIVAKLAPKNFM